MGTIKVSIVDDHTLFRKAIIELMRGFPRVGEITEAANGREFIDMHRHNWPHVVLMDLEMPKMSGVDTSDYLLTNCPDLKIIVLTQHDSERYMLHMVEMGVHSFLLKNVNPDELERAIYAVVDKDFYHNDLLQRVIRKSIHTKFAAQKPMFHVSLTNREQQIVVYICSELTHKEIGEKLAISEFTVRNHHRNILQKLKLKKTIGLVKYAYERGIVK